MKPGDSKGGGEDSRVSINADGKSVVETPGVTFEAVASKVNFTDCSTWEDKSFSTKRNKGGAK